MICVNAMGNTTTHLSLCIGKSSRETRHERPYVSRPFWPYEHQEITQRIDSHCQNIAPKLTSRFLPMSMDVLQTYQDCPFCLKLLYEPVSTLCGHTFCLLCLERFIIASDSILKCPICREDLTYLRASSSRLKANTILHNLFRESYSTEYEIRRNELENERKNIIKKRLIIGNTHQLLPCDYHHKRHEWTLFVQLDNDEDEEISEYIKQVKVNLHPTFTPSEIILDKAPFRLTRIGWGVFTVHLAIEFHAKWNKSDLVTNWFLSFTNMGNQKSIEIGFQKPVDESVAN